LIDVGARLPLLAFTVAGAVGVLVG
jgi:hypothetical protein